MRSSTRTPPGPTCSLGVTPQHGFASPHPSRRQKRQNLAEEVGVKVTGMVPNSLGVVWGRADQPAPSRNSTQEAGTSTSFDSLL